MTNFICRNYVVWPIFLWMFSLLLKEPIFCFYLYIYILTNIIQQMITHFMKVVCIQSFHWQVVLN